MKLIVDRLHLAAVERRLMAFVALFRPVLDGAVHLRESAGDVNLVIEADRARSCQRASNAFGRGTSRASRTSALERLLAGPARN